MTAPTQGRLPSVKVDIFEEQTQEMEPMIQKIAEMAKAGEPGMLLAQVFRGHIQVFAINGEQARDFGNILGVKVTAPCDMQGAGE